MATGSRHFQTITVLRFTDDGTNLISGGDDNLVVVWNMSRCVCLSVCLPLPMLVCTCVYTTHNMPVCACDIDAFMINCK